MLLIGARTVPSRNELGRSTAADPPINYILVNDVATLAWCASLASLEIHPFLHRVPRIDLPTAVVFDLDPGEGMDALGCA